MLSQDYDNIEHIIIDDGSSDRTKELVQQYKGSGKVRYFYQENSGNSVASNKTRRLTWSTVIMFLSIKKAMTSLGKTWHATQEKSKHDLLTFNNSR